MAASFRFLGTNVDATFITDISGMGVTFVITELRGYGPPEIMNGIDLEVQEYHQADLIQMAMNQNVALYRNDIRGEVCIFLPAAPAGRFNGRNSIMTVEDVTVASSGSLQLPISIRATFRLNQMEVNNILEQDLSPTLYSADLSQNFSIAYTVRVTPDRQIFLDPSIALTNQVGAEFTYSVMNGVDMCIETELRIETGANGYLISFIVNGDPIQNRTVPPVTVDIDELDFTLGALSHGNQYSDYFEGIIRNFVVTSSAGVLVNIIDPSTGTNTGSAADGTPTNVESVSVIV